MLDVPCVGETTLLDIEWLSTTEEEPGAAR